MQESAGFTRNDLAKYPFLKETAEYIKPLHLQIDDLASMGPELVKRAEDRVNEALIERRVTRNPKRFDVEIPEFPACPAHCDGNRQLPHQEAVRAGGG